MKSTLRLIGVLGFAAIFSGCAASGYVLGSRAPTSIRSVVTFSSSGEKAIPTSNEMALLYDREPWVMFEVENDNGSSWVHYAIVLKNNSKTSQSFFAKKVRLQTKDGKSMPAKYSLDDKVQDLEVVDAATYFRLTVSFLVTKSVIDQYGGSSKPMHLVVPVKGGKELKLPVWLWET